MKDDTRTEDEQESPDSERVWDLGLRELFSEEEEKESSSILVWLENKYGRSSRVSLQDDPGGPASVVNSKSAEVTDHSRWCGRYRLLGEIARGGMGVVLQGRDEDLGRDVALKVLREGYAEDHHMIRRFVEEAQIGGQLQHPGIVPVYEMGLDDRGRPFFTMKLVRGRTFADLLADRKAPADDRGSLLSIFLQVCQTLAYAHARGVIHRDLKPANVMVGAFGEVQVVDWGFAKVLGRGGVADERRALDQEQGEKVATVRSDSVGSQSVAGSVLGTPPYMPPEQATGAVETLDERADVFSLGAILCEVLTGRPPYTRKVGSEVIEQAADASLDEAWERLAGADADPELADLAKRCLQPDRSDRPRHAGILAEALASHLAGSERRTREAQVSAAEARVRAAAERKARRLTLALAAAIVAAVTLAGGLWWWNDHQRSRDLLRANEEIRSALADATTLSAADSWAASEEALRRAESVVAAGRGEEDLRHEVHELALRLRAERSRSEERAARTARNADLLSRLEAVISQPLDDESNGTEEFEATFQHFGIEVFALEPEEVAQAIIDFGENMRVPVAFALDDWALRLGSGLRGPRPERGPRRGERRPARSGEERSPEQPPRERGPGGERSKWRHLIQAARLTDPHEWRDELREASLSRDVTRLRALATDLDATERHPRSLTLLSLSLASVRDRDAALQVLRAAWLAHADDFWINFQLSMLLAGNRRFGPWGRQARTPEARDLAEALRHAWIARSLQPDSTAVRLSLAALLELAGRPDEAEAIYAEAAHHRDSREGAMLLARLHIDRGAMARAETELARALKKDLDDPEVHRALRMTRWLSDRRARRQVPDRLAALRRWLDERPEQAEGHVDLGEILFLVADFDGAAEACHTALRLKEELPSAHRLLAACLIETGDYRAAIASAERALELDADSRDAQRVLEDARRLRNLEPRVAPWIERGEKPESAADILTLARACLHRGQAVAAARLFSDALDDQTTTGAEEQSPTLRSRRGRGRGGRGPTAVRSDLRDAVSAFAAAASRPASAGPEPSDDERTRWRLRALAGLGAAIAREASRSQNRRSGGRDPRALEGWRHDLRLAGLRDPDGLATLPEAERREWREAWGELDRLLGSPQGQ